MSPPSPLFAIARVGCAAAFGSLASLLPAEETATSSPPPPPLSQPSDAAAALDALEAAAPQDASDQEALKSNHARTIALIESNVLSTGSHFRRAALLFTYNQAEFRIIRVQYELMLAAVAMDGPEAAPLLFSLYDTLMARSGRPARFDFHDFAKCHPESYELDPAPTCIADVWRDPVAARTRAVATTDNPEIIAIRDGDQADRRRNWNTFTTEERAALKQRDIQRNLRMREIIAAGDLRTVNDFSRAALVMQHSGRYDGIRLAHELAVASLLLGDRRMGRWLVAASYDRLLRTAALDQRFGTQIGPEGPIRVDETGISDAQRRALGCPSLAEARSRQQRGSLIVPKAPGESVQASKSDRGPNK